jgi:DNA repair protein RadC
MKTQQLDLFPGGEDTPLFSGTPLKVMVKASQPREATSPTRHFVCTMCQDTGTVKCRGKRTTAVGGVCAAGQPAQSPGMPKASLASRETHGLQGPSPAARVSTGQILREAMQIDHPATRLTTLGPQALTLVELLSFVLGTPNDPLAAGHLLAELKTLTAIKARSVQELAALGHGITQERARRLLAALELGDRLRLPREERPLIKSPTDVANLLGDMSTLEQEQLRVILLDTKGRVIHIATVYQGSVHTTVIRVGEVMKAAVRMNATAIIVCHNHPSGDSSPSPEDVAVTTEIVKAAKLLDIDCLDHIIIGEAGTFVSLKERGVGFAS